MSAAAVHCRCSFYSIKLVLQVLDVEEYEPISDVTMGELGFESIGNGKLNCNFNYF